MDTEQNVTQKAVIKISGIVQGVGFRPFVLRYADKNGIKGFVRNEGGQVLIHAFGNPRSLAAFADGILRDSPAGSRIISFDKRISELPPSELTPPGFIIAKSSADLSGEVMPTPDLAVCGDCLKELFTKGDPRYRNPFISCTLCGPRFSVLRRMPYDRENISMSDFPMCGFCASQYHDESDRRCHAQTVCCNGCGPVLGFVGAGCTASGEKALENAVRALKKGQIVAVKGIGGYHLACSPFLGFSADKLRILKGREHKPFAVMFSELSEIKEHCEVNPGEEALLCGSERPIVLLKRRENSSVSESVSLKSRFLGAFLPYTPLQCMLLKETGPLIMTSANATGLPIIKDDEEMLRFYNGHDELFGVLLHDRKIERRLDDSVMAFACGFPQFVRRARGFVPTAACYSGEGGPAVLSLGPQQKNTVCLSKNGYFYPSAEIGDLDTAEACGVYRGAVRDMRELFSIKPEVAVCDLHPDYESTRFAESLGLPLVRVQHHFAHIASVLAEENIKERVIGVAFDGTGCGTDGTVWGGEFLIASPFGFSRAGHISPVKFLGSDESVKQGWKSAFCLLAHAGITPSDGRFPVVEAALKNGVNTIISTSMGRVFDAVSSILGICHVSTYEGQCAVELENAAARYRGDAEALPYTISESETAFTADLTQCIKAVYESANKGLDPCFLAMRFHKTVSRLTVDMCLKLRQKYKIGSVALSGGVFQNRILVEDTVPVLKKAGFRVLLNKKVPPNDGGISLGQAYIGRFAGSGSEE
ncbi:MAG: carbamoyltransferase HypF [Bacillota bacterium]|nr:carbamoyltransferase HypF [Bacillota bacterium]